MPAPATAPAVYGFGGALKDAINATKQGGDLTRARALSRLFAQHARAVEVDVVAFIPTPYRRLARRGFDLPAVLAQAFAVARDVPFASMLTLTRGDTALSAGADKKTRALMVHGRFRAAPSTPTRVLLVDDVLTTGATLNEGVRVLTAAGHHVTALALAAKP